MAGDFGDDLASKNVHQHEARVAVRVSAGSRRQVDRVCGDLPVVHGDVRQVVLEDRGVWRLCLLLSKLHEWQKCASEYSSTGYFHISSCGFG